MNSFISWIGGKKLLRKDIISRFPDNYNRYIEVFGGAGWVLFCKDKHANMEVYNDANSELVNLFRCIKFHAGEVQRELSFILNSREVFEDFKGKNIKGMTDIQRAARFFALIKISYGSNGKTFGCARKNVSAIIDYLTEVQKRLSTVVVENKDFESLIKVYDRDRALFYLDPPYFGTEKYYTTEFSTEDHVRLRDTLQDIKGKFILSYNDCEEIRELYKDFNIEAIERQHNLVSRYADKDKSYSERV